MPRESKSNGTTRKPTSSFSARKEREIELSKKVPIELQPWNRRVDPRFGPPVVPEPDTRDPWGRQFRSDSRSAEFRALPKSALLVWCALVTYFDSANRAWPSLRQLSNDCGMAKSNVSRAINKLETAGLVSIAISKGAHGGNIYIRMKPHSLRKMPHAFGRHYPEYDSDDHP